VLKADVEDRVAQAKTREANSHIRVSFEPTPPQADRQRIQEELWRRFGQTFAGYIETRLSFQRDETGPYWRIVSAWRWPQSPKVGGSPREDARDQVLEALQEAGFEAT
jgi:hypothetical protein